MQSAKTLRCMSYLSKRCPLYWWFYFLVSELKRQYQTVLISLSENVGISNWLEGSYLFFNCIELYRDSSLISHPDCFPWIVLLPLHANSLKQNKIWFWFPIYGWLFIWYWENNFVLIYFVSKIANDLEKYNENQILKNLKQKKSYNFIINPLHLKSKKHFLKSF